MRVIRRRQFHPIIRHLYPRQFISPHPLSTTIKSIAEKHQTQSRCLVIRRTTHLLSDPVGLSRISAAAGTVLAVCDARDGGDDGTHDVSEVQGLHDGSDAQEAARVAAMAERHGGRALAEHVLLGAVEAEHDDGEDDHFEADDHVGDDDGKVLVGHFGGGLEVAAGGEEAEDELRVEVSSAFVQILLCEGEKTDGLEKVEEHDAFECNELRHWLPRLGLRLHGLVELQHRYDGDCGRGAVDDHHPDVREVELAGSCAVGAGRFGDLGEDSEEQLDDWELEDGEGGFPICGDRARGLEEGLPLVIVFLDEC